MMTPQASFGASWAPNHSLVLSIRTAPAPCVGGFDALQVYWNPETQHPVSEMMILNNKCCWDNFVVIMLELVLVRQLPTTDTLQLEIQWLVHYCAIIFNGHIHWNCSCLHWLISKGMRLPPILKTTLLLPTNLNLNFLNAFITPKKILDVDKVTFFFSFHTFVN